MTYFKLAVVLPLAVLCLLSTLNPAFAQDADSLVVTETGEVGVSNDNPQAKLDIGSAANDPDLLRFSTGSPWLIRQSGTGDNTHLILQSLLPNRWFSILNDDGNMAFAVRSGNMDAGQSPESVVSGKLKFEDPVGDGSAGIEFSDGTTMHSKFPKPDYDSEWFAMSSQAGANSFKELSHNFGCYPRKVKVYVRAVDGNNQGFIFEGIGSSQNDDDTNHKNYGGLVFAYSQSKIRLWAPSKRTSTSYDYGRIVCVVDGWGNEINKQYSNNAEVRVLAWKGDPDFLD